MTYVTPIEALTEADVPLAGGKAVRLATMAAAGLHVPQGVCLTTDTYRRFLSSAGLQERVALELSRKPFEEMRWEELWDAALRIRNMFLSTAVPPDVRDALRYAVVKHFNDRPVVVRSSSPAEDSPSASFAGLHDSFVGVRGLDGILDHVRLVWASLWSDRSLLYRQELGLDPTASAMAVIIQPLLVGEASGITFGQSPLDPGQLVVEAVYGLNTGLVDGEVEPDRWTLERHDGSVADHQPPAERRLAARSEEPTARPQDHHRADEPPLRPSQLRELSGLSQALGELFGAPQDIEWTYVDDILWAPQARPITRSRGEKDNDKRPWYLSLHRSFENLKELRNKIENEILTGMTANADHLSHIDLSGLSDQDLADEIENREEVVKRWTGVYWDYCIPFAHGVRLFGQVYNDTMRPEDPFEFVELLAGEPLLTLRRNEALARLASQVSKKPELADLLESGRSDELEPSFRESVEAFLAEFGATKAFAAEGNAAPARLAGLLRNLAGKPEEEQASPPRDRTALVEEFINNFESDRRGWARELLDLAQQSYRLRDDDNVYLSRVEGLLSAAKREAAARLQARGLSSSEEIEAREVARALREESYVPRGRPKGRVSKVPGNVQARQLVGQPASRGVASAPARVMLDRGDLFSVSAGEILVCDAISPDMTFVVPLVAAVVERRGGMLIHGAIIAREYGIPCVTGIPAATELIRTGDWVTVDGYLGIVTIAAAS